MGGGIPKEVVGNICSLTVGTGPNAPLPCQAANNVSSSSNPVKVDTLSVSVISEW